MLVGFLWSINKACSMEFLIKRTDGDWFDLHKTRFVEVLRPLSYASKPVQGWGDHRIEVSSCPISFSFEDPGIQVCFEGSNLSQDDAVKVVNEIADNIMKATGQQARVVQISGAKKID
jgi:hypothetical protein